MLSIFKNYHSHPKLQQPLQFDELATINIKIRPSLARRLQFNEGSDYMDRTF